MTSDNSFINIEDIQIDNGPANFIPNNAELVTAWDPGSPGGDRTVIANGFIKNGIFVIQTLEEFEN